MPSSEFRALPYFQHPAKSAKWLETAWSAKHTLNIRTRGLVTRERIRADAHLHTEVRDRKKLGEGEGPLLGFFWWWWVCDEVNAFRDVALETFDAFLKKLLLIVVGVSKNIDGFLCARGLSHLDQHQCEEFGAGAWRTYAELDWDREEFTTNLFGNGIATSNAWKIDEGRFYDALLPL